MVWRWRLLRRKGQETASDSDFEGSSLGGRSDEYRAFFERNPEPMWIYDSASLEILDVNEAAASYYGYEKEEFLRLDLEALRPPDERERLKNFLNVLPPEERARSGPWKHRTKNGRLFDVEVASVSVVFNGKPARMVVVHDISEQIAKQQKLDLLSKAYELLAHLRFFTSLATDEKMYLKEICRAAVEEGKYALCWIGYARDDPDRSVEPIVACGKHTDYLEGITVSWDANRPEGRGPAGRAIREQHLTHIPDIEQYEEFAPWRERARLHGFRSCSFFPFAATNLRGVLCLYSTEEQPYDEPRISVLEKTARELAAGIVQVRTNRSLQELNSAVTRLASLASHRDVRSTIKGVLQIAVETLTASFGVIVRSSGNMPKPTTFVVSESRDAAGQDLRTVDDEFVAVLLQQVPLVLHKAHEITGRQPSDKNANHNFWIHKPLVDSGNGCMLGSLILCYAVPPEHTDILRSGLELFASRISAELIRHELEHRETRTAYLLEKVGNAVVAWDNEKRIVVWNNGAASIYGWSKDEAINRNPELLCSDSTWLHSLMASVESEGQWQGRVQALTKDGEEKVLDLSVDAVDMGDGDPPLTAAIGTDVTSRVRLEEQLRHAERLELIGQLTGGIAHDFNNYLTVIVGNTDLLIEEDPDRDRTRALALEIRQAAHHGAELTKRLLAFARKQPLNPRVININPFLTSCDGLIRRTLGAGIDLEIIQGAGLWDVMIDPVQLEAALLNLCLNARDAMPEGGQLTIESTNVWIDRSYADQYLDVQPGQYVLLAVSDTGIGVPPEHIPKIFEPFFTTKGPGKGTGLGLSMVYGFIKQSQGHIKVYSEVNRGTTFKIYLPRVRPTEHNRPQNHLLARSLPSKATILVVEDNEMIRRFVCEQLNELGYRVLAASDAEEALEQTREGVSIDLLFVDIVMPGGMNGKELADVLRRRIPGLRVLYTSGYTENAIVHQGRLDPDTHLLNKPYTRADLLRMIRAVFAEGRDHE